jgi:hypothetical protein
MITKDKIQELQQSTETFRVECTTSSKSGNSKDTVKILL